MEEITSVPPNQLAEAIKIWTGWGKSPIPTRDDKRLKESYGTKASEELLQVIKKLENDFYSSNAGVIASNIQEVAKLSSEQFKKKHPALPEEITKIFAWCYTFDYK